MAYYRVNFALNYIATIKELKPEEFDPEHSPFYAPDGTLLNMHIEAANEHKAFEIAKDFLQDNLAGIN